MQSVHEKNVEYFIPCNHVAISCTFDVADVVAIVVFIGRNAMTS